MSSRTTRALTAALSAALFLIGLQVRPAAAQNADRTEWTINASDGSGTAATVSPWAVVYDDSAKPTNGKVWFLTNAQGHPPRIGLLDPSVNTTATSNYTEWRPIATVMAANALALNKTTGDLLFTTQSNTPLVMKNGDVDDSFRKFLFLGPNGTTTSNGIIVSGYGVAPDTQSDDVYVSFNIAVTNGPMGIYRFPRGGALSSTPVTLLDEVEYWPIGGSSDSPRELTVDGAGYVWFVQRVGTTGYLARLNPSGTTNNLIKWALPATTPASLNPAGLHVVNGASGASTVCVVSEGNAGSATPTGALYCMTVPSEATIADPGQKAQFRTVPSLSVGQQVAAGPDGKLYLTEQRGNTVAVVGLPETVSAEVAPAPSNSTMVGTYDVRYTDEPVQKVNNSIGVSTLTVPFSTQPISPTGANPQRYALSGTQAQPAGLSRVVSGNNGETLTVFAGAYFRGPLGSPNPAQGKIVRFTWSTGVPRTIVLSQNGMLSDRLWVGNPGTIVRSMTVTHQGAAVNWAVAHVGQCVGANASKPALDASHLQFGIRTSGSTATQTPMTNTFEVRVTALADGEYLSPGLYCGRFTVSDTAPGTDPNRAQPVSAEFLLSVEAAPAIEADPGTLTLSATTPEGQDPPMPPSAFVNVNNIGGGDLSWSATMSPSLGAFFHLIPSASKVELAWHTVPSAGIIEGTLLFCSNAVNVPPPPSPLACPLSQPAGLVVNVEIRIGDFIANQAQLTFTAVLRGAPPASKEFDVTDLEGESVFDAVAVTSSPANPSTPGFAVPWLIVTPPSQLTVDSTATFTVSATNTNPLNPQVEYLPRGTYDGVISIRQEGTTTPTIEIPVTLKITGSVLALSQNEIDLGTVLRTQQVGQASADIDIENQGDETGTYTATVAGGLSSWVSIVSGATDVLDPEEAGMLSLAFDTTGLGKGVHTETVYVTDPHAATMTQAITVTVEVLAPTITAEPAALAFVANEGNNPATTQTLTIRNTGTATLRFTPESSQSWLTISPTGEFQVAPGGTQDFTVSVVSALLAASQTPYDGFITIADPIASNANGSLDVGVELTVAAFGRMTVAPTDAEDLAVLYGVSETLAFEPIVIDNTGSAPFTYGVTLPANAPWLSVTSGGSALVSPSSGGAALRLSANTAGLAPGTYDATVAIDTDDANDGHQTVTVTLVVEAPVLTLDRTAVAASVQRTLGGPADQTVVLSNTGDGLLSFTAEVTSGADWLSVSPIVGEVEGKAGEVISSTDLTLSFDTPGLAKGTHPGTIEISDPHAVESTRTITVTLTVTAPIIEVVGPVPAFTVDERQNPAPQVLTIRNAGDAPLRFTPAVTGGWLSVSPEGEIEIPAQQSREFTLTVASASLDPGDYDDGSVTIEDPTAEGETAVVIPIELTVNAAAVPTFTDTTFELEAIRNGVNPPNQIVTLGNAGSAAYIYTLGEPSESWLTIVDAGPGSVAGGEGDVNLAFGVNLAGLTAGVHTATVAISSEALAEPHIVTVRLEITAPTILLTPALIEKVLVKTSATPNDTVTVQNTGNAPLDYTAEVTSDSPWLTIASGGGTTPLVLQYQTEGLDKGLHEATVEVSDPHASNSPQLVTVKIEVRAPEITVTPTSLSFTVNQSQNPAGQTLTVRNTGNALLRFVPQTTGLELSLSSSGLVNLIPGAAELMTVSLVSAGLAPGEYDGSIVIEDPTASPETVVTVPVHLTVVAVALPDVSPTSFDLGAIYGDTATRTVTLANNGGADYEYSFGTPSAAWLTVVGPTSGTVSPGADVGVELAIETTGLTAGPHSATVAISSTAFSAAQVITVDLMVNASSISVSPPSLSLDVTRTAASPADQFVTVSNAASATASASYSASVTSGSEWLSLAAPTTGAIAAGGSAQLQLHFDTSSLARGHYVGVITVADAHSPAAARTITVSLDVQAPVIQVSQASLAFTATVGSNPASQSFTVSNTGDADLHFTPDVVASAPDGWLVVSPEGAHTIAPGGSILLNVQVISAALAAGSGYTGSITIADPVAEEPSKTVSVTLDVQSQPVLDVTPTTIALTAVKGGANPDNQSVTITNSGSGSMAYSVGAASQTWLSVVGGGNGTLTAGQSATLALAINTSGLSKGPHSATVQVSAPGATEAPKTVTVNLTIQAPIIVVTPATLTFSASQGSNPATQTITVRNDGDAPLTFTPSVTSSTPDNWLSVSPAGPSTVPANGSLQLTVTVDSDQLAAGSGYTGSITIADATAGSSPQVVNVSLTVEATALEGHMTGAGFVTVPGERVSFVLKVREREPQGERGFLAVRISYWGQVHGDDNCRRNHHHHGIWNRYDDDRFVSRTVTSVTFSDDPGFIPGNPNRPLPTVDTVVFSGIGEWNGQPGYRYEVKATDRGEPGRGLDTFAITIWNPAQVIVASYSEDVLDRGNIQSHRLRNRTPQAPDTTAPVLTLPSNMVREATSAAGAAVTYSTSARDAVSGNVDVMCAPPSGTTFPLGATTVSCIATDDAGNDAVGSFTVTVRDTTPPAITVPDDISKTATNASGAAVTFTATATDIVSGPLTPTCTPASGSTFPIGTTTVTCAVTDAALNSGTESFDVTVKSPTVVGAKIRRGPTFNGGSLVQGSVWVMNAENVTLNGSAEITGSLVMAGTPQLVRNGNSEFGGTTNGAGSSSPNSHRLTLNGGSSLGGLVQRTNAISLPSVAAPPSPSGSRNVSLNRSSDSPGSFSTIRDLTLNGSNIVINVPAGNYGSFTANGNNRLVLGVAGSSTPTVYNFKKLTLNGSSRLDIVGPVIVTVGGAMATSGSIGSPSNPNWLTLKIANGGFTLNGSVSVFANVIAPSGHVTINGGTQLTGSVIADDLTLNGSGRLILVTTP